jgi:hypothetical protein
MLVLILYVGLANQLVLFHSFKEKPIVFFVPILLSGILILKHRIQFSRNFILLIFFYLFYFAAITIKYKAIYPSLLVQYPSVFLIAYVLIKTLKYDLFKIYEYFLYVFAIIGLIFWTLQVALGGDTLYGLLANIPNIEKFSHVTGGGYNIIFYSVQPAFASVLYSHLPPRNCGFAWEPGSFAVYLCLALFVNLFMLKDEKYRVRHLVVLLLALFTTQSTTGFFIIIIIGVYYYFNSSLKSIFLTLPLMILGIGLIFSLPFMTEKIMSLTVNAESIDAIVEAGYGRETSITPQRFTSFMIAIRDFLYNPVFGTAGISGESWTEKIGVNISAISGIGNLLGHFGIVGFLFFMIVTIRSSIQLSRHFRYKGVLLLFLIILSISISYYILFIPLIVCFWIFALFHE